MTTQHRQTTFITVFLVLSLALWSLLRLGLLSFTMMSVPNHGLQWWDLVKVLIAGLWFDVMTLCYLLPILLLPRILLPNRWQNADWALRLRWRMLAIASFLLLFGVLAECVFWQEFNTRFNFIAVDYLVYTHEVIGNIVESYPVGALLSGIGLIALVLTQAIKRFASWQINIVHQQERIRLAFIAILLPTFSLFFSSVDQMEISQNQMANELSGNGIFTFSAAARRNELRYDQFYLTMPQHKADAILKGLGVMRQPLSSVLPLSSDDKLKQVKQTQQNYLSDHSGMGPLLKRPKNIVLISVESLSASYLGAYGNNEGLTPQMDALISQGLKFENMFATGTRTVRGLEALSLGIPPIPGQSVVHRPNNEHLATIGELLEAQGFSTFFIYGGYGVFDNMNNYFRGNDYRIVDRTDFAPSTIIQENVWGVADESLFNNSLTILDNTQHSQKPFFAHIMTTSNHRPFTYPTGRIDLKQGHREGAVKYTDYAIGDFIRKASTKPWFKETLFVIIADHCASSAGKTKLPVDKYHIAAFLYNPNIVPSSTYPRMASQIDLAPTLLDILGVAGRDHFFGASLFREPKKDEHVFISNYQELGYLKNNTLIVLSPKKMSKAYRVNPQSLESTPTTMNTQLLNEAIAFYQTASTSYRAGALSEFAPN